MDQILAEREKYPLSPGVGTKFTLTVSLSPSDEIEVLHLEFVPRPGSMWFGGVGMHGYNEKNSYF